MNPTPLWWGIWPVSHCFWVLVLPSTVWHCTLSKRCPTSLCIRKIFCSCLYHQCNARHYNKVTSKPKFHKWLVGKRIQFEAPKYVGASVCILEGHILASFILWGLWYVIDWRQIYQIQFKDNQSSKVLRSINDKGCKVRGLSVNKEGCILVMAQETYRPAIQ